MDRPAASAIAGRPRRLGLNGAEWAQAQVDTIRLKLFMIGAIVRIGVRRILLQLSSTYRWKDIFGQAFRALRCRSALRSDNSTSTLVHVLDWRSHPQNPRWNDPNTPSHVRNYLDRSTPAQKP
ncbi:MAG: transposase [Terracidiphilus sp.]|nr:transposase [Terracidiphilus sp.]